MREIERIIKKQFTVGQLPSGKEICEQQLIKVIDEIEKVKVNEEEIEAQVRMAEQGRPDQAGGIDGVQPLPGILQERS